MREQLIDLIETYKGRLDTAERDQIRNPYSGYHAAEQDCYSSVIDDLEYLLDNSN